MSIVNMVQIQTWFPVVLLRISISPIIISIVMLPSKISHVYRKIIMSKVIAHLRNTSIYVFLNRYFLSKKHISAYFGVGRGLPSLLRHCCTFSF